VAVRNCKVDVGDTPVGGGGTRPIGAGPPPARSRNVHRAAFYQTNPRTLIKSATCVFALFFRGVEQLGRTAISDHILLAG